jgi:hypothetical protein
MDVSTVLQSPFAPLTFVVAPALLTNASSVLAMSTVNRMIRAHDRMHGFFAKSEAGELSDFFLAQVDRVESKRPCSCARCIPFTWRWPRLPALLW